MRPFTKTDWDSVSIHNKRLLDEFVQDLSGKSPETVRKYKSSLELWFVYLMWSRKNKPHTKIQPYMWKRFESWLKKEGEAPGTVQSRMSAISALNKYICEERADEYHFFVRKLQKGANKNGKKDKAERPDEPGAVGSVQPGEHSSAQ